MKDKGLSWDEILSLEKLIKQIAYKYSGDVDLANDVFQEVCIKLHTDKKLNADKFKPNNRPAAIRNVIRNKILTVLTSKKFGRFPFLSLDMMADNAGAQVDENGKLVQNSPRYLEIIDYQGDVDDSYC